jgi:hypothetical protein
MSFYCSISLLDLRSNLKSNQNVSCTEKILQVFGLQLLGVKRKDFETGIAGRFMHNKKKSTFILYPLLSQFIASVAIHVLEHVLF